jgi:hypothetical protein
MRWLLQQLGKRLERLRFPELFLLVFGLLVLNLLLPDPIPFLDELLLLALSALLGSLTRRQAPEPDRGSPPIKNVTPRVPE